MHCFLALCDDHIITVVNVTVQRVYKIHLILIQKSEHLIRAGDHDFHRNLRVLPLQKNKQFFCNFLAQRIRHGDPQMSSHFLLWLHHLLHLTGKLLHAMGVTQDFLAPVCQCHCAVDPLKKDGAKLLLQLPDLK